MGRLGPTEQGSVLMNNDRWAEACPDLCGGAQLNRGAPRSADGEVLLRGYDNRMEQCPGMSCRRDVGRLGHSLLLGSCLRNEVQEHQSGEDSSCSADLHFLLPPLQSQGLNSMFSILPTVLTYLLTGLSPARLPARCRSN